MFNTCCTACVERGTAKRQPAKNQHGGVSVLVDARLRLLTKQCIYPPMERLNNCFNIDAPTYTKQRIAKFQFSKY
jgi:hypothetical protein